MEANFIEEIQAELLKNPESVDFDRIREAYFSFYKKHGFRNDDELHNFIKVVLGYHIPRVAICPHHVAPFQFIADNFFERVGNSVAFASRASGKTRNFSILNFLDAVFKDRCEIVDIGAVLQQAQKCYDYGREYILLPFIFKNCVKDTATMTRFKSGSQIEIHSGTMAGTNSAHPQKANMDEVEVLQNERVLQQFLSMSMSKNGVTGQTRLTSTRKFRSGLMQKILTEIKQGLLDFKVYEWCCWEAKEPCEPERKCEDCPLFDIIGSDGKTQIGCQGRARNSDGFYKVDDLIDKFKSMDLETWETEWLNLRPGYSGLVFKEYDERIHMQNEWAEELTRYNPNLPLYLFADFGEVNPYAVYWGQVKDNRLCLVDEYYRTGKTSEQHAKDVRSQHEQRKYKMVSGIFCGAGGMGDRIARRHLETEFGVTATIGRADDYARKLLRRLLRINPDLGKPRFAMSGHCVNADVEFNSYSYPPAGRVDRNISEEPMDKDNHAMSAIMYGVSGLVKMGILTGIDIEGESKAVPEAIERKEGIRSQIPEKISRISPNSLEAEFDRMRRGGGQIPPIPGISR